MLRSPVATPKAPLPLLLSLLHRATLKTQTPSPQTPVGIFWDLQHTKPPAHLRPLDAANRLKIFAARLGPVRLSVAYTSPLSLPRGPHRPDHPHPCHVCGRRFPDHAKLLHHFHQIHQREHAKRLRRLDSAKGSRRVKLAAAMTVKMDKYRRAVRDLSAPESGSGIADELKRAGVWVRTVPNVPGAAGRALGDHVVDAVEKGVVGCVVLVSDDVGFEGLVREARARCARTVVVGDDGGGGLKRCADAGFSWREVVNGKARDGAGMEVRRWRDGELLRRLEWKYRPEEVVVEEEEEEEERGKCGLEGGDLDRESDEGVELAPTTGLSSSLGRIGPGAWWELEDSASDGAM